MDSKYCPIRFITPPVGMMERRDFHCYENSCAWWLESAKCCAMLAAGTGILFPLRQGFWTTKEMEERRAKCNPPDKGNGDGE